MRVIVVVLLCFQILTSLNCRSKETHDKGSCWLNISYIECLKNKLPCECEESLQNYFSIALDTNSDSKNYGIALSKYDQMEPFIYPIKKIRSNEFEILLAQELNSSWAKLIIRNDSLYLIEKDVLSKFIKSEMSEEYAAQHIQIDNVNLLNKSLAARKYPKLEQIVNQDSLRCECNKWLANSNVLFVKGKPKSWIIKMVNDSLQIMEIINVERDPDDPVQTKKIASYKW
jgi:hypothetical protein